MSTGAGVRVVLGIETSNPSSAVDGSDIGRPGVAIGVVEGGVARVVGVERLRPRGPHHDDLMGAIDRVCRVAGVDRRSIVRVAVSIGPGGYTSLRIATATAMMLGEALRAEVVGVPSAWVAARRVQGSGGRGERFVVALASKGESVWVTVFERGAAGSVVEVVPGRLGGVAEVEASGTGATTLVADGFVPPGLRARVIELGWGVEPLVMEPAACVEVGACVQAYDGVVTPLYGREAEAVVKWRERRG